MVVENGIPDHSADLPVKKFGSVNNMLLTDEDITQLDSECIVNAANNTLIGGGGVDGAIHRAAGPELLLENCYKNSLDVAYDNDIHEISFPAISTGVYGYPKTEAAEIAVKTVQEWMKEHGNYEIIVRFVCFGKADYNFYLETMNV